jgi:hypothetical protein
MATNAAAAASPVRKVYRDLIHVIKQQPHQLSSRGMKELRTKFREPLGEAETIESRLKEAESRLSFARMNASGRIKRRGEATASGRWVYKDGAPIQNVNGTWRDNKGRVVSPYDGNNLDPESVSKHFKNLRRAGFVNNAHAKGFF